MKKVSLVLFSIILFITSSFVLSACNKNYKVTFYVDDAVYYETTVNDFSMPKNNPQKEGYTFVNWYTNVDNEEVFDFENSEIKKDIKVYALWREDAQPPEPVSDPSLFSYETDNNSVTITGLTDNTVESILIPETINSEPVTKIGDFAFSNCTNLKNISMPETITSVGIYAFSDYTNQSST